MTRSIHIHDRRSKFSRIDDPQTYPRERTTTMNKTKTILIADDDIDLLRLLRARCKQLGLKVVTVSDAMTAITSVGLAAPDLVCLDVNMPAGNGLSVAEMIVTNESLRDTPVIMMTGEKNCDIEKRCHSMSVYYVPKNDNTWHRLEPLIRELLEIGQAELADDVQQMRDDEAVADSDSIDALFSALGWEATLADIPDTDDETESANPWILSIDDDSDLSFSMKVRLADHGIDLLRAFEGMEGVRYAYASQAQAIVLDYEMPDVNGDYVLRRLKDNPITKDIPVIVLTGHNDNALKRRMFNIGAAAFLTKPIRWDDLWNELRKYVTAPALSTVEQ